MRKTIGTLNQLRQVVGPVLQFNARLKKFASDKAARSYIASR